jgi:hypothetical protein
MRMLELTRHSLNSNPANCPKPPELLRTGDRSAVALFYGRAHEPLVLAVPDERYAAMWRLVWPRRSDLANLSRIKDAAIAICERGPPARNRRLFRWEWVASKTAPPASPMRSGPSPHVGEGRRP